MIDSDLLLAMGSRLVHIGPPKTGTTEIQSALHLARSRLGQWGVVYPGQRQQMGGAALAVTGAKGPPGARPKPLRLWDELVAEVATAQDSRVVVSSEFLAASNAATAARITRELGGDRVHVVVTLRPLSSIMPSAWQQFVRHGMRMPYGKWLRCMLDKPPYKEPTPNFWRSHRHDALVERWAEVAGADNVTVIVADPDDRRLQLRTFEAMLGIPEGELVASDGHGNRSFTKAEVELVRRLNVRLRADGWQHQRLRRVIRYGVVPALQAIPPLPGEAPIRTPQWALVRAAEIGSDAAARIAASDVRVIGDLSMLGQLASAAPRNPVPTGRGNPTMIRSGVASAAIVAAIRKADSTHPALRPARPKPPPPTFARRVKRRIKRMVRPAG